MISNLRTQMHVLRIVALSLLAASCGQTVESRDFAEPLVIQRGTVALEDGVVLNPDEPLRIALVWMEANTADAFPSFVAQDVEVSPTFPSAFDLPITQLPPESTMMDAAALAQLNAGDGAESPEFSGRLATGLLIVYQDGNGTGHLEFDFSSDRPPEDKLFTRLDGAYSLLYFEGPPFEYQGFSVRPGFSVVQSELVSESTPDPESQVFTKILSVARAGQRDIPLTILSDAVPTDYLWCFSQLAEIPPEVAAAPTDFTTLRPDDKWMCDADDYGTQLSMHRCKMETRVCDEICFDVTDRYPYDTEPALWPCNEACAQLKSETAFDDVDLTKLDAEAWYCDTEPHPTNPYVLPDVPVLKYEYCKEEKHCKRCINDSITLLPGTTPPPGWPCPR